MVEGGSTNGVLHLLALANEAKVALNISDFNRIAAKVPLIGNFKPFGVYAMEDLEKIGGTPVVTKVCDRVAIRMMMMIVMMMNVCSLFSSSSEQLLIEGGLLHGDCLTCTGQTLEESVRHATAPPTGQRVVFPLAQPLAPPLQHVLVLHGNLAPDGAVLKLSGRALRKFEGPARVFDAEEAALDAILAGTIRKGIQLVGDSFAAH